MVKLNTGAHPEEINNCLILPIVIPGFKSVGKKSRQCVNVLRAKMMLFAALMNGINDAVFQIENSIAVDLVEPYFSYGNPFCPHSIRSNVLSFRI